MVEMKRGILTRLFLLLLAGLQHPAVGVLAARSSRPTKSSSRSSSQGAGPSPDVESLTFPIQQPFGSLPLSKANCCPYAGYPVPPRDTELPPLTVVIGAQKAATTLLFQLLILHPKLVVALPQEKGLQGPMKLFRTKEKHFFNALPNRMSEQSLFKYFEMYQKSGDTEGSVWLDATPDYVQTPWAACRLKAAVPNAKLILLLRDPVARTFSHWRMINDKGMWKIPEFLLRGRPLDPFPAAFDQEREWLEAKGCLFEDAKNKTSWNDCFQCHTNFCREYNSTHNLVDNLCEFNAAGHAGIIMNSLYAPQLAWWLNFFPPEQLLVLSSEYFVDHKEEVMKEVFEFMGLEPITFTEEQVSEKNEEIAKHRTHKPIKAFDPDTHAEKLKELYKFFEPYNQQLYTLLDSMGVKNFQKFPTEYVKSAGGDR